jgi:hypothetical protein
MREEKELEEDVADRDIQPETAAHGPGWEMDWEQFRY